MSCYASGTGVAADDKQALFWGRKAFDQGYGGARVKSRTPYANGGGFDQGFFKVKLDGWYREAVEQRDAIEQLSQGLCFAKGQSVGGDFVQAVSWYRKGADRGDAQAQVNLGVCYYNGIGVVLDDALAISWWRRAAERGHASAQFNLGACYDNGIGVKRDFAQAMSWYRKAAEQGHIPSLYNIGIMYEKGHGVTKDDGEAYAWFKLSDTCNDDQFKDFRALRDDVEKRLTPEQKDWANKRFTVLLNEIDSRMAAKKASK
jgi:TPR repeat protein